MDLLPYLADARAKGLSWKEVAARLRQLEASAPLAPSGQPWIRAVEAISRYSANHLRRMVKALSLVEAMRRQWPDYASRLSGLSFSHAEVLGRLWEIDPNQVETLLKAERWPGYAQLLALYENARSRRSAPRAAGKLAIGQLRRHVQGLLHHRFGPALLERVPYHPYIKPDFLVVLAERQVLAWDCILLPDRIDEEALRRRFVAWATESTFVTQFWIVAQDDRGLDFMQSCIAELELANIGVVAADLSGFRIEPWGPPIPDRRHAAGMMAFRF